MDFFIFLACFLVSVLVICYKMESRNKPQILKYPLLNMMLSNKKSYFGHKLIYSKFEAKQSRSKLADFFATLEKIKKWACNQN